jgi:hypothetical protein
VSPKLDFARLVRLSTSRMDPEETLGRDEFESLI